MFEPSSVNCTPMTPTLSLALADTGPALPATIAPAEGAVRNTAGADVSLLEMLLPVPVEPPLLVEPLLPSVIVRYGRKPALPCSALANERYRSLAFVASELSRTP